MGQGPASFLPLITPRRKSSRSRLWVKMEAGLSGSCGNSPPEQPQQGCYFWQLLQPGFAQKRSEQKQLRAAVRAAVPPASAFVSVPVSHLLRAWVGRKPRLGPSLCEGRREGGGGCAGQRETTSPRALGAAPEPASCCPQSSLHPQTRGAGAAPRDPYAGTLLVVFFFPLPLSTEEKTPLLRVAAETPPGSGCLVWLPSFSVPPGLPAGSCRGRPRGAGGEVGSPTAPDLTT